jgi:hypothetical protein
LERNNWIVFVLLGGALASGLLVASISKKQDDCLVVDPHIVGMKISENYMMDYDTVMDWYRQAHSFDDIILALETSDLLSGYSPQGLLAMRQEGLSWDEIWDRVELTP